MLGLCIQWIVFPLFVFFCKSKKYFCLLISLWEFELLWIIFQVYSRVLGWIWRRKKSFLFFFKCIENDTKSFIDWKHIKPFRIDLRRGYTLDVSYTLKSVRLLRLNRIHNKSTKLKTHIYFLWGCRPIFRPIFIILVFCTTTNTIKRIISSFSSISSFSPFFLLVFLLSSLSLT